MKLPPVWTADRLEKDRRKAIEAFRADRLGEPLEAYASLVNQQHAVVEELLAQTEDLQVLDGETLSGVLANTQMRDAFRYLAGPPISDDDWKTLSEVETLASSRLDEDPEARRRLVDVILTALDRRRFPWVQEQREPTAREKSAAILASACLWAYQRAQADRRSTGRSRLESVVRETLLDFGFVEVAAKSVRVLKDAPGPGEFCRETSVAGRMADFVAGLPDGRYLLFECKDSNSLVNSVKRLNNDTAAKAVFWTRTFGQRMVIPVAVISGVYYRESLVRAQDDGLFIFWGHALQELSAWLSKVGPLRDLT